MKFSKLSVLLTAAIVLLLLLSACGRDDREEEPTPAPTAAEPTPGPTASPVVDEEDPDEPIVDEGPLVPPVILTPCAADCPFEGQTISVLVNAGGEAGPLSAPLYELRDEFEAATGATLDIVEVPAQQHYLRLLTDLATATGQRFDVSIAHASWLGELVEGDLIVPYDDIAARMAGSTDVPAWEPDDVLPVPRALLSYGDANYIVANDHDAMIMVYRRDLLEDPEHQAAFADAYGYELPVPTTWDEFHDVAEFFNGMDLNGDGEPDSGLTMHLKANDGASAHFQALSAPFVIGPDNPLDYWFDFETMESLINSPGHVRALETLVALTQFGPEQMTDWGPDESWEHFADGRAALTFAWGNLGGLTQSEESSVRGVTGFAPLPGTMEYYDVNAGDWSEATEINQVGNVVGGSWGGVISAYSDAQEAAYFLLSLMASPEKSRIYAARGWDGIDVGRTSHLLAPDGSAGLDSYQEAGWDEQDAEDYSRAYAGTYGADLQLPYLRIPGSAEYLTALDLQIAAALSGEQSEENALNMTAEAFESITDRLGRDLQLQSYDKGFVYVD